MVGRSPYPCLDELRRYRTFPCSKCEAPDCWMGRKPSTKQLVLHPGQRACGCCDTPFTAYGRTRYCSETCRYRAMMARRARRT